MPSTEPFDIREYWREEEAANARGLDLPMPALGLITVDDVLAGRDVPPAGYRLVQHENPCGPLARAHLRSLSTPVLVGAGLLAAAWFVFGPHRERDY